MTTLYREVKIETPEQAEALPEGTVALALPGQPVGSIAHRCGCGDRSCRWLDEGRSRTSGHVVGWTALVPIEAEEETAVVIGKAGLNDPATNPYTDVCMDSDGNVWFGGDRSMIDVTEEYNEWASKNLSTRYVTEWTEKA